MALYKFYHSIVLYIISLYLLKQKGMFVTAKQNSYNCL